MPPTWHAPEEQPEGREPITPAQLQSAADYIRQGFNSSLEPFPKGPDYENGARSITVTQGKLKGKWVFTVSTSVRRDGDGNLKWTLTSGELIRAKEVFGPTGFTEVREPQRGCEWNAPPNHSEQRGERATPDQEERWQATSNVSTPRKGKPSLGEPCEDCSTAQRNANITNVTDRQTNKYDGAPCGDWSKSNVRDAHRN